MWGFFGLWGIRGILKVNYNRAFSEILSKTMMTSASQNMFCPIFQVIYLKIYTYIAVNLLHFGGISCIFRKFYGILRRKFLGDFFTKIWSF
jgi:hypothetical protein